MTPLTDSFREQADANGTLLSHERLWRALNDLGVSVKHGTGAIRATYQVVPKTFATAPRDAHLVRVFASGVVVLMVSHVRELHPDKVDQVESLFASFDLRTHDSPQLTTGPSPFNALAVRSAEIAEAIRNAVELLDAPVTDETMST